MIGTESAPLRTAIVGSGPAGFYLAESLLGRKDVVATVDMFERLPAPHGLVRYGVAPDHQKIKSVTRVYDRVASRPGFRFFGNVTYGQHVTLDDLAAHYHEVCFATGAQTDRRMDIPGEDLGRSHTATEFVAWYNGHPDYRTHRFDLSQEHVAVVGVGNVAVDVARILCRTPEELEKTDIAGYALEALRESRVRVVTMLGRRGPAQAAFTNPEVKELGEMPGADIAVRPDEIALDPLTKADVEARPDRNTARKLEILESFMGRAPGAKPRTLVLRFLVSPTEILGDDAGDARAMTLVQNELYRDERGGLRPRATESTEELPAGLVFRSVGYRGVPIPGLPFHENWGVVPNEGGRVTGASGPLRGLYVTGWIKRGPSGVIGTNKPDAVETADAMLADRAANTFDPASPDPESVARLVRSRQPDVITYEDWLRLDAIETERGAASGRPRVKMITPGEALAAIGRQPTA